MRNGAVLLAVAWPVLAIWRARRRGIDRVEAALLVAFTAYAFMAQRFLGFYALVAAPYLARDFEEWVASRRSARSARPARRALAISAACIAVAVPEWTNPASRLGTGIDWSVLPVSACEFMEREGIAGRGFNIFHLGGYMQFRFWPDRSHLPFMDAHQEVTPKPDRELYHDSLVSSEAWRELDDKYHFDYALIARNQLRFLDRLDEDSTWALVFIEDPAALYVRRAGPLASVAERDGYRWVVGGTRGLEELRARCREHRGTCEEIRGELERAAASSPANAGTLSLLANADLMMGRWTITGRVSRSREPAGGHRGLDAGRPSSGGTVRRMGRLRRRGREPTQGERCIRDKLVYSQVMSRARSHRRREASSLAARRLSEAERLFQDFRELTPFRFRPFAISFASFREYERWRRAQKNPWYR